MKKPLRREQRLRIIADSLERMGLGYLRRDPDGVTRGKTDDAEFLRQLARRLVRKLRRQRSSSEGK
jgi:hypothetical protein